MKLIGYLVAGILIIAFSIGAMLKLTGPWFVVIAFIGYVSQVIGELFKKSISGRLKKVGLYLTILGLTLSCLQPIVVDKYKEQTIHTARAIQNTYNIILYLQRNASDDTKELVSKEHTVKQYINLDDIFRQISEEGSAKDSRKKGYASHQMEDQSDESPNISEKLQYDQSKSSVQQTNLGERFCQNGAGSSIKHKKFIDAFNNLGRKKIDVTYNHKGFKSRLHMVAKTIYIDDVTIPLIMDESHTLFIYSTSQYEFDLQWLIRRAGDIVVEPTQDKSEVDGFVIKSISSNNDFWEILDIREGDIILNLGSIRLKRGIGVKTLEKYIMQKNLHQVPVTILREGRLVYKLFTKVW